MHLKYYIEEDNVVSFSFVMRTTFSNPVIYRIHNIFLKLLIGCDSEGGVDRHLYLAFSRRWEGSCGGSWSHSLGCHLGWRASGVERQKVSYRLAMKVFYVIYLDKTKLLISVHICYGYGFIRLQDDLQISTFFINYARKNVLSLQRLMVTYFINTYKF